MTYWTHGTIYLLHEDTPGQAARHHLGFAEDLAARLAAHRSRPGADFLHTLSALGSGFQVARTWPRRSRAHARRLDAAPPASLCPLCRAAGGEQ